MAARLPSSPPVLVLDAGALLAWVRGDVRLRARLLKALDGRAEVLVPPAVVTQTVRGGPRDAPLNQLLTRVDVPSVDESLARLAGTLLGRSGSADVADAQIAAEAIRSAPAIVLTGDVADMQLLLDGVSDVEVVAL